MLIGNGYAAMVVNGYASREVANNNQKRVECPHIPRNDDAIAQSGVNI